MGEEGQGRDICHIPETTMGIDNFWSQHIR